MSYSIADQHGTFIGQGIPSETKARESAQHFATHIGAPVYLHDSESPDAEPLEFAPETGAVGTTITNITLDRVLALAAEAATAGDDATVADCAVVEQAYTRHTGDLEWTADERAALERLVTVIRNAEAQQ